VPGIVIALAVLLFYIRTPIWGTVWILVVGQVIRYLPFTTRVVSTNLLQIHAELEEAAWASGASRFVTFRRVLLPLLAPAIANGWVWVAVHSMRDFTFPIMLGTFGNLVIASLLWSLWERGEYSQVGAMATVLALVSMLFAFAARRLVSQSTV
jgi:iron(III) transport system permease protein